MKKKYQTKFREKKYTQYVFTSIPSLPIAYEP